MSESPDETPDAPSDDAAPAESRPGRETAPGPDSWRPDLHPGWFLYPAYLFALIGGGLAASFALDSFEWSAGPVALAWGLLFVWFWLYGVGYRYRRPALKYLALAMALGFGGLLCGFAVDRAIPQFAATEESAAVRGAVLRLVWASISTGLGVASIVVHAILFSRSRGS